MDTKDYLIYKGILLEIRWIEHLEMYHWIAYASNEDYHNKKKFADSLKHLGFEVEEAAIAHAKQEIDFLLDDYDDKR
ncbi:MAG: hypothetical protein KAF91_32840 [Nostoc sp. TH1S01]|nr:hypothetical protein [Nostoc sp. TH1S01]